MSEEGGEKITEIQVLQNGHDIEKSALNAESGSNASELVLSLGNNLLNYQAALSFTVRRFHSPPPFFLLVVFLSLEQKKCFSISNSMQIFNSVFKYLSELI